MDKLLKMAEIYYKCSAVSIDSKYLLKLNQFVVQCIAKNIGTEDENTVFFSLAANGGLSLINQLAQKMEESTVELSSMEKAAAVRRRRYN